jgi:hypothetical protein
MRGDRDRLRGLDFCPDGWDFCHFCPLGLDFCSDFYPDFCQRLLSKNFSVLSLLSGALMRLETTQTRPSSRWPWRQIFGGSTL